MPLIPYSRAGLALHVHSPYTACTGTEPARCYPRPRTPRGPRPRPPLPDGWVARRPCTLTLAPARRRLGGNGLDDATKQALRAAARSGLELYL